MAVTYEWIIHQCDRDLASGGITTIHWRCNAKDGDHTATNYGTTGHKPDKNAEGFIKYEDVKLTDALGWVEAQVNKTDVEASLASQIKLKKNPVTGTGLPWS